MNRELTEPELELAKRVKQAWLIRKETEHDFSQEKLAENLEMSQGMVSHYLNGRRAFTANALYKFCDVLDLDFHELAPWISQQEKDAAEMKEFAKLFGKASPNIKSGVMSILRGDASTSS